MSEWLSAVSILISGVNLGFILKLIYNDIHYLRERLDKHIDEHNKGD